MAAEESELAKDEEKYKHKKKKKKIDKDDLYELLGIGHLRWQATAEEIKKACTYSYHLSGS